MHASQERPCNQAHCLPIDFIFSVLLPSCVSLAKFVTMIALFSMPVIWRPLALRCWTRNGYIGRRNDSVYTLSWKMPLYTTMAVGHFCMKLLTCLSQHPGLVKMKFPRFSTSSLPMYSIDVNAEVSCAHHSLKTIHSLSWKYGTCGKQVLFARVNTEANDLTSEVEKIHIYLPACLAI